MCTIVSDRQMWCICLLKLVVAKFECKYNVCECNLVVVRHIVYVNVLAVIEQMCRVSQLECVCLVLFRPTDAMHLFA